ncbi:hypothetical protein ACHAXR_003409, partial [Thalassiosira sp. AJA248-18]
MANNDDGGFHRPPSTFSGDRGGMAEDAELLAELRAISMKSSSRFADDNDNDDQHEDGNMTTSNNDNNNTTTTNDETAGEKEDAAVITENDTQGGNSGDQVGGSNAEALTAVAEEDRAANDHDVGNSCGEDEPAATTTTTEQEGDTTVSEESVNANEDDTNASRKEEANTLGLGGFTSSSSNLPNTFVGDRGGSAEDAELLAELRAISNKSSSSNRFDDDGSNEVVVSDPTPQNEDSTNEDKAVDDDKPKPKSNKTKRPLPPWKQKGAKIFATNDDLDIVIAAPPTATSPTAVAAVNPFQNVLLDEPAETKDDGDDVQEESSASNVVADEATNEVTVEEPIDAVGMMKSSNLPNTFSGDRGGMAEDAELLAELRAISMKSSGNRFDGGEGDEEAAVPAPASANANLDVDANEGKPDNVVAEKPWKKKKAKTQSVPPWKQNKSNKKKPVVTDNFDVVIAAPPAPSESVLVNDNGQLDSAADSSSNVAAENEDSVAAATQEETIGIKPSNLPNTFQGDRGGSAEDADLLAELRAISMKSSTNRFDGGEEGGEDDGDSSSIAVQTGNEKPWKKKSTKKDKGKNAPSKDVPPWKIKVGAKKAPANDTVDVVIAAPPAPAVEEDEVDDDDDDEAFFPNAAVPTNVVVPPAQPSPEQTMGIQSSLPNTFNGDRGGDAVDEELLAELRAISMKSSSSNRFDGDEDGGGPTNNGRIQECPSNEENIEEEKAGGAVKEKKANADKKSRPLPPWKKKGAKKKAATENDDMDIVIAAPPAPAAMNPFQNAMPDEETEEEM